MLTPLKNAPPNLSNAVSILSVSKMAAGVHQDRGLSTPLESMDGQTDVKKEREDPGLMTSIGL